MATQFRDELTRKLASFLTDIGIEVIPAKLDASTFLPGILVQNGTLLIDEDKLTYPGDLLHEAGHLALAPPNLRETLSDEVVFPDQLMEPIEVQVMAWSYAAALHLGIEPAVVFHDGGYRGDSQKLLHNFSLGGYLGVNGLQDAGLTAFGARAGELGVAPYPHMLKWLRD